jgi:hypothetical protein
VVVNPENSFPETTSFCVAVPVDDGDRLMIEEQIRAAIEAASSWQLNELSETIWKFHSAGHLDDDAAQGLAELLQARRRLGQIMAAQARESWQQPAPPRYRPYRQRSPDRAASIARRRQLASAGPLPPQLAACFTVSEQAALKVISDTVQAKGYCDLTIAEIAARAGTCETTVRNATREAERLAMISVERRPQRGRKSFTNVIRIIRHEWKVWLSHRQRRPASGIGCKKIGATATDLLSGCDLRDQNGIWRPGWRREGALSEPR